MSRPKNDTLLRALHREGTPHTPIWLMRQAGRYLPEYCATRTRAGSFLNLAQNPELATEVTMQPLARYPLDAAILFSDILTVPDAMGLELGFFEGEGPRFNRPVRDEAAVAALAVPDLERLRYVFDAVSLIKQTLNGSLPLIGFSGSPWTLACYMVEGSGSDDFRTVKTMLYQRPDLMHAILRINAAAVTAYLNAQIDAGVDVVMIFDSWGGTLADRAYQEFSLAYMQSVMGALQRERDGERIPVVLFTKGGGLWIDAIAASGPDAIGVDWTVNLGAARTRVGARCALQGNLDPSVLFAGEEQIRAQARAVIDSYGAHDSVGHVFNLGHGISQFTPPESVAFLVDEVHRYSSLRTKA